MKKKELKEKEIALMNEINKEIAHLKKTGIPRCSTCKKNMVKESEHTWKPTCKCMPKDLRLMMG